MKSLIVIPCLNEEAYLETLVGSLLPSCDPLTSRIVIADGGSTDRTLAIAQKFVAGYSQVVLLSNPKKIQSAAINLAVETYGAEAEFIIRIDAHATYPADYCRILIEEAERTKADSVVVAMQTVGKTPFQIVVAAAQNSRLGNGGSTHRLASKDGRWVIHGHHALMRVDAFRFVGGYDETFICNEDAELDFRLTQAKKKIWLTGATEMIYYPRATPISLLRQYIGYGSGRARTMLKHKVIPSLRQLIPAFILPTILLALLTPWFTVAILPLCLWVFACLMNGFILAGDAQDFSLVMAGPATILMHAGWSFGFWREMIAGALS